VPVTVKNPTPGGGSSQRLTVTVTPVPLSLSPTTATLRVQEGLLFTVTSATPAGTQGLLVTLTASGTGGLTVPASVTIPAGQRSAVVTVTGAAVGTMTLTASAPSRIAARSTLTVKARVSITSVTPGSGPVGTAVTLTGQDFNPVAANNQVKFNGVVAMVTSATSTQIRTTVPQGATSGPVTVITPQGSATSPTPFTVLNGPPALTPIGNRTVALGRTVSFTVTATDPEGDPITFAVTPLPLPAHAAFHAQSGQFTFTPDATQVGAFTLTVHAGDGAAASSEAITITVTGAPANGVSGVSGTVTYVGGQPLANVTVTLKATGQSTRTDAQGAFTLNGVPSGRQQLLIDGRTAGDYAILVAPVDLIPKVTTHLASNLTLPAIDNANAVQVNPNATTVVSNPNVPGVTVTIPAGTAKNPDGTAYSGTLSISPVPEYGRPESRPVELRPGLSITIQPAGIRLDPPAPITFPNVDTMAPGNELELWSLSPDTGTFNQVGTMRVSADGQKIETISGGVRATAWHFVLAPPVGTRGSSGDQSGTGGSCPVCSQADLDEGALTVELAIPGVRALGVSRDLTLQYRSTSADVRPILPIDALLSRRAAVPQTFSARLTVGGMQQGEELYWNASGLPLATDSVSRLGVQFDASSLTTGRYPYELMLFSNYPQSSIGGGAFGHVLIRNERTSPFGAGWTLVGLDRLYPQADSSVVLAQGTGTTEVFGQVNRPLVIDSLSAARSAVIGGQNLSFVAGGIYTQARTDLLDATNFGPMGIVPRAVTFRAGVDAITPESLVGVDVFILNPPLTELTQSEAVALEQFVQEGGALLEVRNLNARPQLLGTVPGPPASDNTAPFTVDGLNSILAQGPFGTAANPVGTGFNYSFAVTGAGTVIANNDVGPDLLLLPPATIVTDLGRAVLLGDEEAFASGFTSGGANFYSANKTLFLNTIAFLAGTPGFRIPSLPPSTTPIFVGPPGEFSTLVRHADGTYTRTTKDGMTTTFNAQGLQAAVTDRHGNTTAYAYDSSGRLTTITDPTGQVTSLAYGGSRLATLTDPAGRVTRFTHEADGTLAALTYADGSQARLTYDPQGRMLQRTDARGQLFRYGYDHAGRFAQSILPTGEVRRLTPAQRAAVPNLAAGEGTKQNPAPLAAPNPSASFTDARGHTTTFQVDAQGRITQQTDALNRVTTIERDSQGNPTKITRPNGAATTMTYDAKGNLLTTTEQAIAATTTFTYEAAFHQVTSIKDPKNNTTTITYDAKGNPLTIKDAQNNQTTLTYDSRGLLLTSKDALNQTTRFTYDAQGRLLSTTDPLNRTTTLAYDAAGNVATSTDAVGRVTTFAYDAFNRLRTVTDPATGVTRYTYDGNGNLLTVKDAKAQVTTFVYDVMNRLRSTTDPLGRTETYSYDGADNLLTRVTPKNETITFAYDAVNQLLSKTLPGNQVTRYTYDPAGNLTGVTDPDSALTMSYDLANRLSSVSTAGSSHQPSVVLNYSYDKTGNRVTLVDPTGSNTYVYDALNRLTSLTSPSGATTYAFDALSRRTAVTLPNGTQTSYNYDPASQVTQILHRLTSTGAALNQAGYAYNAVGNRTGLTDKRGTQSFGYDPLDRLTSASHPLLATPQSFAYDPVGNRTTNGSLYNVGNQLTEGANFTYTYDLNGNLTQKTFKVSGNHTDYRYDAENRLIKVEEFAAGATTPGAVSSYRYDGLGRRIEKVGNGMTRRYVYDAEDILLEYDGANALLARYTHGPGIDEPLTMTRGGVNYFYHQDGLGTVTELTDSTGAVAQSYAYDAYGTIIQQTGTVENPYTYTGREFDAETGLSYYRARHYDPRTGRFLQKDPVSFLGGDTNLYRYVRSNPVNFKDVWGLACTCPASDGANWTGLGASVLNVGIGQVKVVSGIALLTVGTAADVTGVGAVLGIPAQVLGGYQLVTGLARTAKGLIGVYRSALECSNESLIDAAARLLPAQSITEPLILGTGKVIDDKFEKFIDILAQ